MKNLVAEISKKEWRYVVLMALTLMVITSIPYGYAALTAPAGYSYNGLTSLTAADNPVYYSYINQVKHGQTVVYDLMTSEPQPLGLFNIFWFLVGKFAWLFNLGPIMAFHLARLLLIPLFVVVAYLFISFIFPKKSQRQVCLALLLFSAGLGAYFVGPISALHLGADKLYWWPNDMWIPESITFLTLYKTPHFIFSATLMVAIFLFFLLAIERRRLWYVLVAGLLSLVYFEFHPFYIPLVYGVIGLYLFLLVLQQKKIIWWQAGYFAMLIAISAPSIIYHFWLLAHDPVLAERAWQNITLAPPAIFLLIGYGLLWPLAVMGVWSFFKNKPLDHKVIFILSWLGCSLVLILLPNQFSSRFTQGLQLPLVVLSTMGWFNFRQQVLSRDQYAKHRFWVTDPVLIAIAWIMLLGGSLIFNYVRDFYYFTYRPDRIEEYFYTSAGTTQAFAALDAMPTKGIVLAHPSDALFIAAFTGHPVYVAHNIETIDFAQKWLYFLWFFRDNGQDEQRQQFLYQNHIGYIFYGPYEKRFGSFNPAGKSYLRQIYANSEIAIYQVL